MEGFQVVTLESVVDVIDGNFNIITLEYLKR